jgi:hypothetical protein
MLNQTYLLAVLVGMSVLLFVMTQHLLAERARTSEALGRYEELRLTLASERQLNQNLQTQLGDLQKSLVQLISDASKQRPQSMMMTHRRNSDGDVDDVNPTLALKVYAKRFMDAWRGDPRPPLTQAFINRVQAEHPARPYYPSREDLIKYFHYGEDPYEGLDVGTELDFAGGYVSYAERTASMIHEAVLRLLGGPPRFLIEVGSFVGSSIVHVWAPLVRKHPEGLMLSVDTWLGDVNMRVLPDFKKFLRPLHGFPSLGIHMLRRMVHTNNTQVVVPLPLSSLVAARALNFCDFTIDVIYVDSAHEQGETYAELVLYYRLIRVGGLLCGDDYFGWPAVKHDVDMFVLSVGERLIHIDGSRPANPMRPEGGQWCVQKKGGIQNS